jgi:mono/diheme cytochrome c family protein
MRLSQPSIVLGAILSLLALPLVGAAPASPAVTHGAVLFHSSGCEHCHGVGGIGGGLGPDLSGVGRALKPVEIERQIKLGGGAGRMGLADPGKGNMPAYGDILSQQEIADLVAYLRTHRSRHRAMPPTQPAKS